MRKEVARLKDSLLPHWTGEVEYHLLKLQRNHMRHVVFRHSGMGWKGAADGCPDSEFIQFDDQFRPIIKPEFQDVRPPSAPVLAPPDRATADTVSLLDASLWDMMGVLVL